MPKQFLFVVIAACLFAIHAPLGQAQEWTRFRGPNGSGINDRQALPVEWSKDNILWKKEIPGEGHSSPVIWGERVFITSTNGKTGERTVLCLQGDTGKTLWQKEFPAKKYKMHKKNSGASSTPTVDANHLYLAWGTPAECLMTALDHDGKLVWQTDLGPYKGNHGFGPSPILFENLVILANDQDKKGYIVALDKSNGQQVWKLPRNSGNATYSTPLLFQPKGKPAELIVTNWKHGMTSIDPKSGKVNWEKSIFEPNKAERAIASPILAGDLILGTCGFVTAQKHFVAMRAPAVNGEKEPVEVWRMERGVSYLPTPLYHNDRVYLTTEKGVASCVNAQTGQVVWEERIANVFYSSPVSDGKHLFCLSIDGDVYVLSLGDKLNVVARNSLDEGSQSTPAISGGRLFLRTDHHLICVGRK